MGTLARPELGGGILVLVFFKQPESLISQNWPLSGYWRMGMKGRRAQVLGGGDKK